MRTRAPGPWQVRAAMRGRPHLFPPFPSGLQGRRSELAALAGLFKPGEPSKIALVGAGGSGKSFLACALAYRVRQRFPGGLHWFRAGPWDAGTLIEMFAIRFGTSRDRRSRLPRLRQFLRSQGPALIVLDNLENDRAVATILNELRNAPTSWLLTARRCLLAGVDVFPVVAPHSTGGTGSFPRVRLLTRLLRHSPLALDIADGLVRSEATTVQALRAWLLDRGVDCIRVVAHEDDVPEVSLLVDWAWGRLNLAQRRILAVLAHTDGDHIDARSLLALARVPPGRQGDRALARLQDWRLVQSPLPGRYALHAVVRCAVAGRTRFSQERFLRHYLTLLENAPERLDLEQTHLYAAMDYAHTVARLDSILRIDRLLAALS